jgi:hypothetical protein
MAGPLPFFGLMISVGLGNGILLPNANAGMLSVRPQLAGSASGLGGAIMIGGGAALSALAGVVLTLGRGGPAAGPADVRQLGRVGPLHPRGDPPRRAIGVVSRGALTDPFAKPTMALQRGGVRWPRRKLYAGPSCARCARGLG